MLPIRFPLETWVFYETCSKPVSSLANSYPFGKQYHKSGLKRSLKVCSQLITEAHCTHAVLVHKVLSIPFLLAQSAVVYMRYWWKPDFTNLQINMKVILRLCFCSINLFLKVSRRLLQVSNSLATLHMLETTPYVRVVRDWIHIKMILLRLQV